MYKFFKKSITRQYLFSLVVVVFFALVGAILLTAININLQENYLGERQELKDKHAVVMEIEEHFMLMAFHARGYYFLKDQRELDFVYREQEALLEKIQQFEALNLDEDEEQFLNEFKLFVTYYNEELLPSSIIHVENDDYVALRQLALSGATNTVINFVGQTQKFANDIDKKLEDINDKILDTVNFFKWLYVAYILLILLILGIVIRKMSKNLGVPLLELTKASEQIVKGEHVELAQLKREDEIGILSRSFQEMARSIQGKEEELTAQNEELLAQQETLEEQQNRLEESVLDLKNLNIALNKSSIVAITDKNGILTYVNDKFCEISKYSRDELIGQDHRVINSNFHSKAFFASLWETISSGQIWTGEIKNKAKDGSYYWVETTIVPYLDQHKKPFQYIAIRTDITEIKLAEQKLLASYEETENRRQLNQDIIDHVNDGITLLDGNGKLLQHNYKFTEILGEEKDFKNSSFKEWSNLFYNRVVDYNEFLTFLKSAISNEGDDVLPYRYIITAPARRIFDIYAVTIRRDKHRLGTLIVHRDITAEYEVDQMKSELVSTVSHELRTPLASVLGFAELMLTKELKPERQKKYLETIYKEASRLTNLINDFLDIQRMESGKQTYEKKRIDVIEVVQDLVNSFKTTNIQHQFSIELDKDQIDILGDEEKLIQVFTNLISNAVKFSPDGGKVTIRIRREDKHVSIAIKDEGLGIPDEEVSKLFQKFYRIDNSDRRKIGGTGLGLAISKQIVEAHNGEIAVSSVQGEGSTFTVKLPAIVATSLNNRTVEPKNSDVPLLIIVEDDESLAMLLSEELKELKLEVKHYSDGESAIAAIKIRQPNLIVLDIMLGTKMDGWAVIEDLKNDVSTKAIPIIISSALDEKERGLNLGIDHYLTKPYPHGKLSEVVLELLKIGGKTGEILIPVEETDKEEKKG